MRTSWLLVSIAVHGAAVAAAVGFGAYASPRSQLPLAHIEIQQQQASAPAPTHVVKMPDVTAEEVVEEVAVHELVVSEEPVPEAPVEPTIFEAQVEPSPSELMSFATTERIRRKSPDPALETRQEELPQPVEVSEPQVYVEAQRSDNKPPAYPRKELRLSREGSVTVSVSVDENGKVLGVALVEGSRFQGFNSAAIQAAREWVFAPATQDGVAVASEIHVEVVFQLTDR